MLVAALALAAVAVASVARFAVAGVAERTAFAFAVTVHNVAAFAGTTTKLVADAFDRERGSTICAPCRQFAVVTEASVASILAKL